MNKIVLFDGHNLLHRCMFSTDVQIASPTPNYNRLFFLLFNSMYFSIFRNDPCKEIIYANDDKESWRKLFFPRYKESRKLKKNPNIDWDLLFEKTNLFLEDVKKYLPIKVIHISKCEADDIIGVITLNPKNNRKYVIISTDTDFLQVTSSNVSVYNPNIKEYNEKIDTERFLKLLFLQGQKKDDIFNVLTDDNHLVGERKPSFGVKKAEKIFASGIDDYISENNLLKNYKRNQVLIDFRKIPNIIKDRIMKQYTEYKMCEPGNVRRIFEKYEWALDNFQVIERNLMRLWDIKE